MIKLVDTSKAEITLIMKREFSLLLLFSSLKLIILTLRLFCDLFESLSNEVVFMSSFISLIYLLMYLDCFVIFLDCFYKFSDSSLISFIDLSMSFNYSLMSFNFSSIFFNCSSMFLSYLFTSFICFFISKSSLSKSSIILLF